MREKSNRLSPGLRPCIFALSFLAALDARAGSLEYNEYNSEFGYPDQTMVDYSDWMKTLSDSARMSDLSVPGTHDSTTFTSSGSAGFGYVKTQAASFESQFTLGVRALDIRARCINDTFAIHHGQYYLDKNFNDVLNSVITFLTSHPKEVIFMRLQHEYDDSNCTKTFTQVFQSYMTSSVTPYIWQDSPTAPNTNPTLGLLRGKLVVFNTASDSTYAPIRYDSLSIGVDGDYYNPSSDDDKMSHVIPHLNATNTGPSGTTYMTYLSGYTSGANTPAGLAEDVNRRTREYLSENLLHRTGFVMADFPGGSLTGTIIAHNYERLSGSGNDGNWGTWGAIELCKPGEFVYSYQQRSEDSGGDDTGLNAVEMRCGNPAMNNLTTTITSGAETWGTWGGYATCPSYDEPVTGFNMKIEAPQGSGDDTAANEAHLYCGTSHTHIFSPVQTNWGNYTSNLYCSAGKAVIGFQSRVEFSGALSSGDDTAMNGMRVICADFRGWTYQEIQNRWYSNEYINIESSLASSSIIPGWTSALWNLQQIPGSTHVRIRNAWKSNQYLNIENGSLQSTTIALGWTSAQWDVVPVPGTNYVQLRNVWKPEQYIHREYGVLQAGTANPGWWSGHWLIH